MRLQLQKEKEKKKKNQKSRVKSCWYSYKKTHYLESRERAGKKKKRKEYVIADITRGQHEISTEANIQNTKKKMQRKRSSTYAHFIEK